MKNPFLRPDASGGSFLPQDYVARKAELRANLFCLGLFGVVMFGVIGAFFVTNRQWLQVQQSQKTVTVQYQQESAKIEQLKKLEDQKAEMIEKAEITTALIEKVPRSILLAELITRMPQDITLLELNLVSKRVKEPAAAPASKTTAAASPAVKNLSAKPTAPVAAAKSSKPPAAKDAKAETPEKVPPPKFEYTLHLVGVARANSNVADYQTALNACQLLDKVDLKYIAPATIDKLELRKFEIEVTLKKDADARGIEPVKELRSAGVPGSDPTKAAAVGKNNPVVTVHEGKEEK